MLFPPACSSPSAGHLAGPVHENGQLLTTLSVWYHSLSGNISFHLQACYGLLPLPARAGYMACWVESLCISWSAVTTFSPSPMPRYVVTFHYPSSAVLYILLPAPSKGRIELWRERSSGRPFLTFTQMYGDSGTKLVRPPPKDVFLMDKDDFFLSLHR